MCDKLGGLIKANQAWSAPVQFVSEQVSASGLLSASLGGASWVLLKSSAFPQNVTVLICAVAIQWFSQSVEILKGTPRLCFDKHVSWDMKKEKKKKKPQWRVDDVWMVSLRGEFTMRTAKQSDSQHMGCLWNISWLSIRHNELLFWNR